MVVVSLAKIYMIMRSWFEPVPSNKDLSGSLEIQFSMARVQHGCTV